MDLTHRQFLLPAALSDASPPVPREIPRNHTYRTRQHLRTNSGASHKMCLFLAETNQLRTLAEGVGALLQDTIESTLTRPAATGAGDTSERKDTYYVPIQLKRLYRDHKLGSMIAGEICTIKANHL